MSRKVFRDYIRKTSVKEVFLWENLQLTPKNDKNQHMARERDENRRDEGGQIDLLFPQVVEIELPGGVKVPIAIGMPPGVEVLYPNDELRVVQVALAVVQDSERPSSDEEELDGPLIVLMTTARTEDERDSNGKVIKNGGWTADLSRKTGSPLEILDIAQALKNQHGIVIDVVAACSGSGVTWDTLDGINTRGVLFSNVPHAEDDKQSFGAGIVSMSSSKNAALYMQMPDPGNRTNLEAFRNARQLN